jgi:hypothetical protein
MDDKQRDAAMQRWRQKCKPMPPERSAVPFERTFSSDEWQKVVRGVVPRQMEDKWLVYTEGRTIFFHRSWTGYCIYQLSVEQQGDTWAVREAIVNGNRAQHQGSDVAYEASLLDFLIDALLLQKPASFPIQSGLPQNVPAGLYQHAVSGTAFPEVQTPGKKDDDGSA